jgi:CRP-like cAMP-binding protein
MPNSLESRPNRTRCASCPVRERALFKVVPAEYINDAEASRTDQYTLPARRHLYEEGSPASMAYTLFKGWMLLYRSHSDGGRQGLRIALPGDFIGYMPLDEKLVHHSALAVTDAVLCGFRQDDLHAMLDTHAGLASHITRIQARYMASCQSAMLGLGRKSAEQRIAYLIAELYFRLRNRQQIGSDEMSMPFPMTQEMLGDMTGLTPVHTNRVLRKLRADGVFTAERQRLIIHDLAGLQELGEFTNTAVE